MARLQIAIVILPMDAVDASPASPGKVPSLNSPIAEES